MRLSLGELAQTGGHGPGFFVLTELDERLDKLGRDRERARIAHSLALGVLPGRPQALGRVLRLAREKLRCPERPEGLELIPADAARLGACVCLRPAPPGLLDDSATGGVERTASLVHRPVEQLTVGRLGPAVESTPGHTPFP